jgi:hypothetical protein
MKLKPIPLAAYSKEFIPPVTGVGGKTAPVANSFDATGLFAGRSRIGSLSKKRRLEELDQVFDQSVRYPPLSPPDRPNLDLGEIKTLLVAATAASEEVGPMLESQDLDPKIKLIGNLSLALLSLVAGIVENGLVPMAGGGGGGAEPKSPRFGAGPPPPPKPAAGISELKEALEKADLESILFDADLGNVSLGNRNGLAVAFSNGIRKAAIATAESKAAESGDGESARDPGEAVRAMNDALDCVTEMDFIGLKSEKAKNRPGSEAAAKSHFTMPVKLKFDDRSSRLHFEKSIKYHCGLRAVMSLPKPIREEQALVARALRDRYPGDMITVRPDIGSLHFVAFRKKATERRWSRCSESVPIPSGIMLPDYKVRKVIALPAAVPELEISPAPDQLMLDMTASQDSTQGQPEHSGS